MKRLKTELVCCLRRSLILLWEGHSLPKRPVSPHLDSQGMAFSVGTRSQQSEAALATAATTNRPQLGAHAQSNLTCGNWGQFKYFQNTSPSQNLSAGAARGQHCSPPPQAMFSLPFLGVLGSGLLRMTCASGLLWDNQLCTKAPSYSCVDGCDLVISIQCHQTLHTCLYTPMPSSKWELENDEWGGEMGGGTNGLVMLGAGAQIKAMRPLPSCHRELLFPESTFKQLTTQCSFQIFWSAPNVCVFAFCYHKYSHTCHILFCILLQPTHWKLASQSTA